MQAQFESDRKVYPISAIMNGGASMAGPTYDIVDMRNLATVCATQNTYTELLPIISELNANLEAGVYDSGHTGIADDALLAVLKLNEPKVVQKLEQAVRADENRVSDRTEQVKAPASLRFVAPLEPLEKL